MGMVTRAGSIGGNLYKMVTSIETQKWGEALSAGINMSKTVANICGIKTEGSQDIQGTLDGTVALAMTGTIATEGIIRNSTVTSGVASPTFYLKDFDYTNAPAKGAGGAGRDFAVADCGTLPSVEPVQVGRGLSGLSAAAALDVLPADGAPLECCRLRFRRRF